MSSNAVVITAANSKGGCEIDQRSSSSAANTPLRAIGFTSLTPTLRSAWFAGRRWASNPEWITVSEATAANIREEIERARDVADVVLIDVEGTANAALTLAVAYANLVIVPATISPPDVEDGLGTIKLIRDMAHASGRDIPHGFLWSNVPPAIRSREMMNLESQVAGRRTRLFRGFSSAPAFAALFSFATTLDQLPRQEVAGIDKAKADAIRLTDAIDAMLNPQAAPAANHEAAA